MAFAQRCRSTKPSHWKEGTRNFDWKATRNGIYILWRRQLPEIDGDLVKFRGLLQLFIQKQIQQRRQVRPGRLHIGIPTDPVARMQRQ